MFTPTLRCECAQPASDRLMRKWCIHSYSCILVDLWPMASLRKGGHSPLVLSPSTAPNFNFVRQSMAKHNIQLQAVYHDFCNVRVPIVSVKPLIFPLNPSPECVQV